MTIDKEKLKALAESPRCGAVWPQFESICGKTKNGATTWQCGECARKEAANLRGEMEKYFGLYKEADSHAVHWESQSRLKGRLLKTTDKERDQLKAENETLREHKQLLVDLRETHGFDSWAAALVEIDRLKAENEVLRKDAERYRWLRRTEYWDNHYDDQKGEWIVESYEEVRNRTGKQLDGSIDSAIAKEAK